MGCTNQWWFLGWSSSEPGARRRNGAVRTLRRCPRSVATPLRSAPRQSARGRRCHRPRCRRRRRRRMCPRKLRWKPGICWWLPGKLWFECLYMFVCFLSFAADVLAILGWICWECLQKTFFQFLGPMSANPRKVLRWRTRPRLTAR